MSEHFEVITDAVTGQQTIRPYTEEEIAALATRFPPDADQKHNRAVAYRDEADPLFFKAQRGEATIEDWEAKVAEIKARFPYAAER